MDVIDSFDGPYRWLSNFSPQRVTYAGYEYRTVEHAYQAAKTLDEAARCAIQAADTPGRAKRLGQRVPLRPGWEDAKVTVMGTLVSRKFQDPTLAQALVATGDAWLIEGNTWRDQVWGATRGADGEWVGENRLGHILMAVRQRLAIEWVALDGAVMPLPGV